MEKVKLPSGAELIIVPAPFADSKDLYQAVLEELKGIKAEGSKQLDTNFIKDVLCALLSSKKVEVALHKCALRCLVGEQKLSLDYFEPITKREDYIPAIQEIAVVNIEPFLKGLSALLNLGLEKIPKSQS